MNDELQRMPSFGIRVARTLPRQAAIDFLVNSENLDISAGQAELRAAKYFMQDFCMHYKILSYIKVVVDTDIRYEKEYHDRCVVYHLGQLKDLFKESLAEELMFNLYEIHLVLDKDDGKVLRIYGDREVNNDDVFNRRKNCYVVLIVRVGPQACIQSIFKVFKNLK